MTPPARFTRAKIQNGHVPHEFHLYRKRVPVKAQRIDGSFTVQTREGTLTCDDGWLAIDSQGWPYPIAADEFDAIYEPAGEIKTESDTPVDDALDKAQDDFMNAECAHITCNNAAADDGGVLAHGVPLCPRHAGIVGGFQTTADIVSENRLLHGDLFHANARARIAGALAAALTVYTIVMYFYG